MADLYFLLERVLTAYQFLVFLWVVLGWLQMFGALPMNRPIAVVMDVLYRLCEPSLRFFRNLIPPLGGLDFSPLFVILGIELVKIVLRNLLF